MRRAAVALALLVVLAGCAAPLTEERQPTAGSPSAEMPTPTGTDRTDDGSTPATTETTADGGASGDDATPTPRTEGRVAVSGQALAFDEEAVYRDVVAMHGRSYDDAPRVDLRVTPRADPSRSSQVWDAPAFVRLWGFDPANLSGTEIAGLAIGTRVFLYTEPVPTVEGRKAILAHEYTHVLQHDTGAFQETARGIQAGDGNAPRVYVAVIEGTAAFAQSRYAQRHLGVSPTERSWAEVSANRSRFGAYVVAPYYFGPRYVAERVDGVANLSTVYERPPTTTEQVIHGLAPGEEPARELAVHVETGEEWTVTGRRVRGELFVRLVLEGELSHERAAAAAAGWGADRQVTVSSADGNRTGHAWVLRWDGPAEADEFAAAMRAYLDASGEPTGGRWDDDGTAFDLRRAGEETVVVLAGPERFVDGATVTGENDSVTVAVGG